jgi:hypothetical protein
MSRLRLLASLYALALLGAAALNYVPGITDAEGRAFGIFALDVFDDALHLVSALWALAAALTSARASRLFLVIFGALYLADGALGFVTGSGYLDLGILRWGWQPWDTTFRILANAPHIFLGGVALGAGLLVDRE